MCTLCNVYGTEKIEDVAMLKEVIDIVGKEMIHDKGQLDHALKMIDVWMDGDVARDLDMEAMWETRKS